MRRALPLLPAWVLGTWLLVWGKGVWDPDSLGPNLHGGTMAAGWIVVIALVLGSALYVAAPTVGRKLAVSSSSSMLVGLGEPNGAQSAFGAVVVRVAVLAGMYLLLGSLAFGLR